MLDSRCVGEDIHRTTSEKDNKIRERKVLPGSFRVSRIRLIEGDSREKRHLFVDSSNLTSEREPPFPWYGNPPYTDKGRF